MPLLAQIAAPTHVARLTALGVAFTGAGLFAVAKPALETPAQQGSPTIMMTTPVEIALDVPVATQTEAPPLAQTSSRSVAMVFTAQGATWMKLEDLVTHDHAMEGVARSALPKHGDVRHARDEYVESAIAPMAIDDVPPAYADRLGEKIIVDGTCTTYITGFAVVARLTGSPGYSGHDTDEEWTARSVLQYGAPMIAAKLGDCGGTIARDATLPPAITARTWQHADAGLVSAAKRLLLRSKTAHATTKAWTEFHSDNELRDRSADAPAHWSAHAATTWQTQMLTHPTTNETWISIHAHQLEGCGMPTVNVWGLYRVNADRTLTAEDVSLGDIQTIDQLVDLDGDGMWEVIGRAWLGATLVNDAKGSTLERLDVPFYGCPC